MAPLRTLAVILSAGCAAAGLVALSAAPTPAGAVSAGDRGSAGSGVGTVKGVGATFPQPVYLRWAALYAAENLGAAIAYEGAGSGAGLKAIQNGGVAFGASDAPRDEAQLREDALVQFPTLVGGVVPVVDLPGVGPGDLVLDGRVLADLFLRPRMFWDDRDIVRLNPHLPLPHLPVVPMRRSDRSGTTAVLAAYLASVAHDYDGLFHDHPAELSPVGPAFDGSAGMADAVASTPGAIGYLGFDFAQERRLAYTDLVNPAGRVVQPTLASVAAAAAGADWSGAMAPSLVARPGGASWPIVTATYVLMRRINNDKAAVGGALRFFAWAGRHGGPAAEDLGFVPLPEAAAAAARGRLREVGDASGHPLLDDP